MTQLVPNYGQEVGLHELENEIKILFVAGPEYVMQFDDVGVTNFGQNLNFSVGSLRINIISKGSEYFLKRKGLMRSLTLYLPDMSISPASD